MLESDPLTLPESGGEPCREDEAYAAGQLAGYEDAIDLTDYWRIRGLIHDEDTALLRRLGYPIAFVLGLAIGYGVSR